MPVAGERPSRLTTLERQLLLINGRPGVRIQDTSLEEIGNATGRFRLIVVLEDLASLHLVRRRQSRLVGGRPVAKLCHRGLEFLSRARRFTGAQSVDHARRSARARLRPAVLRGAGRHRRRPHRRVRLLQRSLAGRRQAPHQRQHQDRVVRISRQHRAAAIAEIDADADRRLRFQQRHRERFLRPGLPRPYPHREPRAQTTGSRTISAAPTI